MSWRTLKKQRKDYLFNLRYDFYRRLEKYWLYKQWEDPSPINEDELHDIAEEAYFLFGKEIYNHVISLQQRPHQNSPFFADKAFSEPFKKYLSLTN